MPRPAAFLSSFIGLLLALALGMARAQEAEPAAAPAKDAAQEEPEAPAALAAAEPTRWELRAEFAFMAARFASGADADLALKKLSYAGLPLRIALGYEMSSDWSLGASFTQMDFKYVGTTSPSATQRTNASTASTTDLDVKNSLLALQAQRRWLFLDAQAMLALRLGLLIADSQLQGTYAFTTVPGSTKTTNLSGTATNVQPLIALLGEYPLDAALGITLGYEWVPSFTVQDSAKLAPVEIQPSNFFIGLRGRF